MAVFDLDSWQEIFHSLRQNPLRTAMTAFGVFWGIFMLVIIMGSANGLENGVRSNFRGGASNSVYMWAQRTTVAYAGFKPGRSFSMNNGDYEYLKANLTDAQTISPRNQMGGYRGGNVVSRKTESGTFSVMGDHPQIKDIASILISEGRFINPLDLEEGRKVAVIGKRVKELLFEEGEDPIGDYIRISGVYFQVIGVFHSKAKGERGERETQRIHVPFTTFQRAFNYGDRVAWFAIRSKDGIPVTQVEEQALAILKSRHKIAPEDKRAIGHFNLEKEYNRTQTLFTGISFLGWFVGFFTLMAGAIGVTNIMLVVVKERTKEIGIRRALGAKPWSIISQIILEAVALTTFAGYFGLAAGLGLLEAVTAIMDSMQIDTGMFSHPTIYLDLAVKAILILIGAGIVAGMVPAQRAVRISPVDALRTD